MVRARLPVLLICMAFAAACSEGSRPTGPRTPVPNPGPAPGPTPNPGPYVVTGATQSATDGSAAPSVSFTVNGTLIGISGANGSFSAGFPASGLNRATLTASGFVTRETGISAPANDLTLSLIPSTFDIAAFDQMFRHSSSGLTRWRTAPSLVVERRVVQFTQICAQSYQAIEPTIGGSDTDAILTDMRDGFDMLTAGRLGPLASVSTQTSDAGATITPRQSGRILVMRGEGLTATTGFWGYACWSTTGDGEVTGGFIILDNAFENSTSPNHVPFKRSLRMHELGHTLGCQHVSTGRVSVMNSNARTEPNDFDRQAARVAALRPTGNRTPDIDPPSHTATALRAPQSVTWHGAH